MPTESAPARTSAPRRSSIVLFEGFELLDVFGPAELFGMVDCDVEYVGPTAGPVASAQGVEVVAEQSYADLADRGASDVLLIPGGRGTRSLVKDTRFLEWLGQVGGRADVVASVCTGSALLAGAGLLDGYAATSNKAAFTWARSFETDVEWRPQARGVHDRDRWTSSGVAAGMDMAVALIGDLYGADFARDAALRAEYAPHTDPAWDPFAEAHGLTSDTA